jgi:hypothetical protein
VIVKLLCATAHTDLIFSYWEKCIEQLIAALSLPITAQYLGSLLVAGSFVVLGWIMLSIARPSWDVRRPAPPISTVPSTTTLHRESLDHENLQIWAPRLGIAFVLSGAFMFALEAANDIPKGSSWDWEHLAAFPIAGAVGAILAFVLALAVAAVKRALGKSPKTAKWAARFLGSVPDVPAGPVTVLTAGAPGILLLALAAVAGGAAGGTRPRRRRTACCAPEKRPNEHCSRPVDYASLVCNQLQHRRCCLSRIDRAQAKSKGEAALE